MSSRSSSTLVAPYRLLVKPTEGESAVTQVQAAATRLEDALQGLKGDRITASNLAGLARTASAAIVASCASTKLTDVPFIVRPAVIILAKLFDECATMLRDLNLKKGVLSRLGLGKAKAPDGLNDYTAACSGLANILQIRDGRAILVENPNMPLSLVESDQDTVLGNGVSNLRAAYDGFKSVALTLVNASDGQSLPIKAVAQTILQVLKHIETFNDTKNQVEDIRRRITTLWNAVADNYKPGLQSTLDNHVHRFFGILQRTAVRLCVMQAIKPFKRFAALESMVKILREEIVALEDATASLNTALAANNASGIALIQKGVQELKTIMAAAHSKPGTVLISAVLPPPPNVFHGRDAIVETYVALLLERPPVQVAIAIMGAGGMGKTTLARAVLHDARVAAVFRDRSFFITAEAAASTDDFSTAILTTLGVSSSNDPLAAIVHHLRSYEHALLVLDNLETIWNPTNAEDRGKTERLLGALAALPSLALVITCRGDHVPPDIEWSNLNDSKLDSIPLDAAQKTFTAIAGEITDVEEVSKLEELLEEVSRIPLAVTLLAQLAKRGQKPSKLLLRWRRVHTGMIWTQKNSKLDSLDRSIQLSLDYLPADDAKPRQLLTICAMLPDGLRPRVQEELQDRDCFADIEGTLYVLRGLALVSTEPDGSIKMLSPVRHYVLEKSWLESSYRAALCHIYFRIAAGAPAELDEHFRTRATEITAEQGNLNAMLLSEMQRLGPEPTEELVTAVLSLSRFVYWTVPTDTLLLMLRPHLGRHPKWQADCLYALARIHYRRDDYDEAIKCSLEARELYDERRDMLSSAWCTHCIAECKRLQGSLDDAEQNFGAARGVFSQLDYQYGDATCLHDMAYVARVRGDLNLARERFGTARTIFTRLGRQLDVTNCIRGTGFMHLEQKNYTAAGSELSTALVEFERLGDRSGAGYCHMYLASVWRLQRQFDKAMEHLVAARSIFSNIGDRFGVSGSYLHEGYAWKDQDQKAKAAHAFREALAVHTEMGTRGYIELCEKLLAGLDP